MIAAICAAMTLAVAVYVFYLRDNDTAGAEKSRLAFLRERKDVVYENLRDLNFEYQAGKLPEADYQAMRASLENEAVALLAEIERLEADPEAVAAETCS
ncbi:MAG TPA: hypothetical protein VFA60_01665 [Terriglobales bacterium]|nr:hypothetical protein [Terriglobales bacterium]